MYFSRWPGVIDSAFHGNFANGPFRWFPRFGESWSYRSALRQRAYGGEMKALYSDVYIIVVHRNSPPSFFRPTISYHFFDILTLAISFFPRLRPFAATLFRLPFTSIRLPLLFPFNFYRPL